jgi:LmbE family N-acetylglucosaminyl deacetylase
VVTNVLVIAPHMDDEVLGCGGILQLAEIEKAHVLFMTGGLAGTDTRMGEEYQNADRRMEMEEVARGLGFTPWVLDHLTHTLDTVPVRELVEDIENLIVATTPDVLLIPALNHDADHRATWLACCAASRPHFYAGTVLEYHTSARPLEATLVVPLTEGQATRKGDMMSRYVTQNTYPEYIYSPEQIGFQARLAGALIHQRYGEAFTPRRVRWRM